MCEQLWKLGIKLHGLKCSGSGSGGDTGICSDVDGGSSGGDGWGGEGSKFAAPDSSSKRDEGEGEGGREHGVAFKTSTHHRGVMGKIHLSYLTTPTGTLTMLYVI